MLVQQAHNRFDLGSWVVAVEGVAGKFVGREGGVGVGKGLSETSLAARGGGSLRGGLVVTFSQARSAEKMFSGYIALREPIVIHT